MKKKEKEKEKKNWKETHTRYAKLNKSNTGAIPVYLSALAISDMGALLSSIPLWIRLSNGFSCNYYSIFYYAHLELTVLNTFMASSIFNVMALTMERSIACSYRYNVNLVKSIKTQPQ